MINTMRGSGRYGTFGTYTRQKRFAVITSDTSKAHFIDDIVWCATVELTLEALINFKSKVEGISLRYRMSEVRKNTVVLSSWVVQCPEVPEAMLTTEGHAEVSVYEERSNRNICSLHILFLVDIYVKLVSPLLG